MSLRVCVIVLILGSPGLVHGREPRPRTGESAAATQLTLQKLVDFSTAIPQGTGAFVDFGEPALFAGEVVFRGLGPNDQLGIYKIDAAGTITPIARNGEPTPGTDATFFDFTFTAPIIDQGDVVFSAFYSSATTFGYGVYRSRNGVLTRLVDFETVPAGGLRYTNITTFDYRQETLTFATLLSDFSQGVYRRSPSGVITELARTGTPAPGGGTFSNFGFSGYQKGVALRGAETWFVADYVDPLRTAVFVAAPPAPVKLLKQIPVLNSNSSTDFGSSVVVANDQQGAFVEQFGGIYRQSGAGPLEKSVGTATSIPGEDSLKFTSFRQPTIDGATAYAFSGYSERLVALLFRLRRGVGVYVDQGAGLQPVVRGANTLEFQLFSFFPPTTLSNTGGDTLDGQQVLSARLGPKGLHAGQVAMHVTFVNGKQALYLATLPTP